MQRCPFCMTEIPDGAIVCRGCGAEKRRGVPGFWAIVAGLVFIGAGFVYLTLDDPIGIIGGFVFGFCFLIYGLVQSKRCELINKKNEWVRPSVQK